MKVYDFTVPELNYFRTYATVKKDIVLSDTFMILFKNFDELSEFFFYA